VEVRQQFVVDERKQLVRTAVQKFATEVAG
jgi:hypothetical protein